jgi:hypothetical protein
MAASMPPAGMTPIRSQGGTQMGTYHFNTPNELVYFNIHHGTAEVAFRSYWKAVDWLMGLTEVDDAR